MEIPIIIALLAYWQICQYKYEEEFVAHICFDEYIPKIQYMLIKKTWLYCFTYISKLGD